MKTEPETFLRARIWSVLRPSAWLIAILIAVSCASSSAFDVLRVGVVAPLSGEQAGVGRDVVDASRLAVEEWNAAGGARGVHLEIVAADEGSPDALRRLSSDARVVLASGFIQPDAATRIRRVFGAPPQVASVLLTNPGPADPLAGAVALAPTVAQVQEVAAAAIAFNFGPVPVAVVASGTSEGIAAAQAFVQAAPTRGLQVRTVLTLANIETNYVQAALSVRNAAAPIVYVVGRGFDAGQLWTELRARDSRVRLMLGPGTLDAGFIRGAGAFLEGVHAIELTLRPADTRGGADFGDAFRGRFGRPPSVDAIRAYDATRLGLQALKAALERGDRTRDGVRTALMSTRQYDGMLRTYTLRDGTPTGWKLAIYRLERDGARVLIGEPEIK